jgi:hypothetical protein
VERSIGVNSMGRSIEASFTAKTIAVNYVEKSIVVNSMGILSRMRRKPVRFTRWNIGLRYRLESGPMYNAARA